MLKYFFENQNIPEIHEVTLYLNQIKIKVAKNNFSLSYDEVARVSSLLDIIKQNAIANNNELLANSQFVAREYIQLFSKLAEYFSLLSENKYSASWAILQDCIDICSCIKQFTDVGNRYEIPQILELLHGYERFYPYKLFMSTELLIVKPKCSICGKSIQSLECNHISGRLYWGEMACSIPTEVKPFRAISLVTRPADKRCIVWESGDKRPEIQKFPLLHEYLGYNFPFLQPYKIIDSTIVRKRRDDIKVVGRNEPCSCGSGKKFKKCCLPKLDYNYQHDTIEPVDIIELQEIR